MFNLIVAVLSIALIGLTAGAAIFYGGDAFTSQGSNAQATALISAGGQISGAQTLHITQRGTANTVPDLEAPGGLIATGFLKSAPTITLRGGGDPLRWQLADDGRLAAIRLAPGADDRQATEICENLRASGGAIVPLAGATAAAEALRLGAGLPSGRNYGCAFISEGAAEDTGVWFLQAL